MTVIAISEVDPQGMVHRNTPLVHVPALRADIIVMQLTGFLKVDLPGRSQVADRLMVRGGYRFHSV